MCRLLIFLLLLPLPLVSQVKILMPVVVKDASGKPVTDLKQSDFQVSGPKNVSIDQMWLVPPLTVSEQDTRTPVAILYDAANATNSSPDLRLKWLRSFFAQLAQHPLPITFYINTPQGVQTVYEPTTPPEVLAAALTPTEKSNLTTNDPKVIDQAEKLKLLDPSSRAGHFVPFGLYGPNSQMKSLVNLAKQLGDSGKRKAVLWLADATNYFYLPLYPPDSPTVNALMPLWEVSTEQLNATNVSVYPDYFGYRPSTMDHSYDWLHGQQNWRPPLAG